MYKRHNSLLPFALEIYFTVKSLRMETRNNSQIISSSCRSKVTQQSYQFIGPKIWNNIPSSIRDSKSVLAKLEKGCTSPGVHDTGHACPIWHAISSNVARERFGKMLLLYLE